MEYFAAIKQNEVDLNMTIWKILKVISLSEKARFRTIYMCVDIYTVCVYVCTYIYICIVIKISFGYKFDGRISSLNTGNLLKWAGSRVNGVCSGVQAAFPWVSTKHKVIFSAQNSRRSLAERGSCWAVRVPLFQVMGI